MSEIKQSSGNVFADLELEDAGDLLVRAELTRQIHDLIKRRGLTQTAAARLLGLAQPDVSQLVRLRHTGFSTDRLLRLLLKLGQDVDIVLKPVSARRRTPGKVRVVAA
ncbi:MAG: XRE family transcriptional regulator [Alphaproteobacteria bacterium]|nr:XRE family transcriptional regulator [Alphaproteobacteria bacterium]